ncbi:hypothetical protein C0Q70_20506 [Pomacea canaliculata]|uniref:Uncharacterized protein n=1 Tax=Pomacea canaliculata TaxID=400727 RepID=A0A2T7NFV6_POMCA|nr:hypothetical protein C0Q70_20506 [Pomacea canaliculata]
MAALVPGPPPLPPPRPSRMSTKRFSVPDILDRDGVYDPEGPSLRRMSTANITSVSSYPEQRFPSSGNSLSPFRIENLPGDRHSLSGSEENLTLSNSLPTIQVTDQDDAPLSPENDYPDNDLSPLTKDQPARFFPKQQQQAEVKQNIYKAVSEASTVYSAHHEPSVETQSTNADSSLEDEEPREDTWRPYDVFQVSEREAENDGAVFREILKVLRLILYFVLITAILGGTVAARASFLLLTSGVVQDDKQKGESVVMLLLCICSPMVVNWFLAFMKILFSGKDWPSLPTFLVLLLLELLHAFGICLLVFRVLPVTDFFRGITITMATFTLPSLFKLILLERKPKAGFWDCMKLIGAILAFLTQVAAIGFFLLTTFPAKGIHSTLPSKDVQITELQQLPSLVWELPLALVLTSLGWWENYVSGEWSMCGKVKLSFQRVRKVAQDVRETVYFLVAPLKIGLIILLAK